jgi:hypothetical protein
MIVTGRASPSEELLRGRLEKAGYVDVQSFTLRLPFGPWAKDKYEPWAAILLSRPASVPDQLPGGPRQTSDTYSLNTPYTHCGV